MLLLRLHISFTAMLTLLLAPFSLFATHFLPFYRACPSRHLFSWGCFWKYFSPCVSRLVRFLLPPSIIIPSPWSSLSFSFFSSLSTLFSGFALHPSPVLVPRFPIHPIIPIACMNVYTYVHKGRFLRIVRGSISEGRDGRAISDSCEITPSCM